MIKPYQLPPLLKPGDLVMAIAPSGSLKTTDALEKGIAIWQERGYRVELGKNYQSCYGYLAGRDRNRREDMTTAWQNPECKAIIAIRGGYGGARLLEDWSWSTNKRKWIIGFSDITSLLWSLATVNISSLHAPVLTTLASEPPWAIDRMFDYLETGKIKPLQGKPGKGGETTGILLPANLTVGIHLLNTPLQPSFKGAIIALEDVTEYPYRIDRMLTQWRMMGVFKEIKGIALGRFSRCEPYPGTKSWTIAEVLRDRLEDLNIPLVYDLPFGHDGVNAALPVGQVVTLNGNTGILSWE
ncbi:LD-carboxypeptidase [Waterburya agarophytonicola K14]|uniref:LD-carboxypeptidase n=1 Tax=Waterburya agarophytonicola KI4 TaxID=2874699 RepID=A0A964BRD9_9CYAN|nr:LD-carboxypeptidase [Waterburya agarophytonicola]MCC0178204.1 LD-carboxypeptidase [Waterburya agarophytonicola KI4]